VSQSATTAATPAQPSATAENGPERSGDSQPAQAEAIVAGAGAADDTAFAPERWRTEWQAIIEAVGRVDMMLAGVLRDCRPVDSRDGVLVVGANHRFHMDTISKPEKTKAITDAAASITGQPVVVETRFTGEESAPVDTTPGVSAVTQAVLQTFDGSRVVATRLRDDVGRQSRRTPPG
jgi:hypothetical protein